MIYVVLANSIDLFAKVLYLLILTHILLSYILDPYHPVRIFVDRMVSPLLDPIRRVVPLIGMFDISPIILIILVQLIASVLVNLLMSQV